MKNHQYEKVMKIIYYKSKEGKTKFIKVLKDIVRNEIDIFLSKKIIPRKKKHMDNIIEFRCKNMMEEIKYAPIHTSILTDTLARKRCEHKLMASEKLQEGCLLPLFGIIMSMVIV